MLRKLIIANFFIIGLFAVSAFGQQNPKPEKNRQEKQNKNGSGGNRKFQQLDIDRDGYISRTEWNGKAKGFERIDTNNDGQISREEFDFSRGQRTGNKSNKPEFA